MNQNRLVPILLAASFAWGPSLALPEESFGLELCVKMDRKSTSRQKIPSENTGIRLRSLCKSKEMSLGSTEDLMAMRKLGISADRDGNDVFEIQSNVLKFRSPVPRSANKTSSQSKGMPEIGETEGSCVGDGFPVLTRGENICSTDADCNNICVEGDNELYFSPCSENFQCDSQGANDGLCSSTAYCQEYAVLTISGQDVYFAGFNVHVRSGAGATDGVINGQGNLIVGYDESHSAAKGTDVKTGSHNLVVGSGHSYSSFGGLVAGSNNALLAESATVSGGRDNVAGGIGSSVSGGSSNLAMGDDASVTGGQANEASGDSSAISGGSTNEASLDFAVVSGGSMNQATDIASWVGGGKHNTASGMHTSVSGGKYNTAASGGSVSGGSYNTAASGRSVSGGSYNTASSSYASVSGGNYNIASGGNSSVSGGSNNVASAESSSVSGGAYNEAGYDGDDCLDYFGCAGSWVGGGSSNRAIGNNSSIVGGSDNIAEDFNSSVIGGWENNAFEHYSTIVGGKNNLAEGYMSSILGGWNNTTKYTSSYSSIIGGQGTEAQGWLQILPWPELAPQPWTNFPNP